MFFWLNTSNVCLILQDYAIETPLTKLTTIEESGTVYEVKIAVNTRSSIAAIKFVLKVPPEAATP